MSGPNNIQAFIVRACFIIVFPQIGISNTVYISYNPHQRSMAAFLRYFNTFSVKREFNAANVMKVLFKCVKKIDCMCQSGYIFSWEVFVTLPTQLPRGVADNVYKLLCGGRNVGGLSFPREAPATCRAWLLWSRGHSGPRGVACRQATGIIMTSRHVNAFCITGGSPYKGPAMRSFDVSFLNYKVKKNGIPGHVFKLK